MKQPVLKGKGFILRPYRKGDEVSLQKNINHRYIYRYTMNIPYPYSMKDANEWIQKCLKNQKNKKLGRFIFAIDINSEVVGAVGFQKPDTHKSEIGYWLNKKYWNRGIMTQALKLVTKFGFEKIGLRRIFATTFVQNKASRRVLEKSGYKLEGIMRKYHKKDNKFIDAAMYAKVR
jgi:RimJ/RimL family protein N-acetyltransferase